jgi:hypothetical protein
VLLDDPFSERCRRVTEQQAALATWADADIIRSARQCLLYQEIKVWLEDWTKATIIDGDDGQVPRIDLVPACLSGAAWRQFADAVLGTAQYRQCQQCPRWFEVGPDSNRLDKRYCGDACRASAYRARSSLQSPKTSQRSMRSSDSP